VPESRFNFYYYDGFTFCLYRMSYAIPFGREYLIYDKWGQYMHTSKSKPLCIDILEYNHYTRLYHMDRKRSYSRYLVMLLPFLLLPIAPICFLIWSIVALYYGRRSDALLLFVFFAISCFIYAFSLLTGFIILIALNHKN
jgi:hypothetical protein